MASVVIAGDVSGTCTLQAANAAGTTVLSLPTTSGTLVATGGAPSFTTVTTGLGNATAPSITFTGDTNTGIFSPTADTIAFTEGGVESMRIDSSGNVGIGTSSPASKLDVVGTITTDGLTSEAANGTITSRASSGFCSFTANTSAGSDAYIFFQQAGTEFGRITAENGGALVFSNGSSATERGRFDTSGNFRFNSGYGSVATAYGCRAWVNFAGATGTINASGGVSSVTRNGTGDYSVNYSFTFPDANYTMWGMGRRNSGSQRPVLMCLSSSATYNQFTTYARFYTMLNDSATIEDPIQFWFGAIR